MQPLGMEHLGELADLYALGTLDDSQRAFVDAHAARCGQCAQDLGEAETTVAALAATRVAPAERLGRRVHASLERPRRHFSWVLPLVAAAALVIGLLPSAAFWQRDRIELSTSAHDSQALGAMVGSHFSHVEFTALQSGAPRAKVIYGRDGGWFYVIADTDRRYAIEATTQAGARKSYGVLQGADHERSLFVPAAPRMREIVILAAGHPIARATLVYPQK